MTELLEKALAEVVRLPDSEQDAIAALILEELADEERWSQAFAGSQDALARMAAKAEGDFKAGRVIAKGFNEI